MRCQLSEVYSYINSLRMDRHRYSAARKAIKESPRSKTFRGLTVNDLYRLCICWLLVAKTDWLGSRGGSSFAGLAEFVHSRDPRCLSGCVGDSGCAPPESAVPTSIPFSVGHGDPP